MNNQGRHTLATISLVIVIVLSAFLMYNLVLALAPNQPTLNSPTNASYINQSSTVLNVTVTDPDGDTMNVTFFNASDNSQICNRTGIANGSYANCTWSSLSDGVYQWFVNVTDGTNTTQSNTWTFTIDTANPTIIINSPTSNSFLSSKTISINLTATDTNLNYTNISIIQGGSIINSTTNTTNGTYLVSLSVSNDGVYNITTTSYDLSTNSNSSTSTNVTIDTTAPNATNEAPQNNSNYTSDSVTFSLKCVDTNPDTLVLYGNWSGSWQANQTNTSPSNNTLWNVTVSNISDGNYIWAAWCNDSAGNLDYADANYTFKIDTTGPTVTFVSPSDNASTVTTRNWTYINVTAVDSLTTVANCTVNWNGTVYNMTEVGSGLSISAWYNKTNLSNGNYSMTVICNDTLGNNGSIASWVYINVNYNAPNVTNISPSSGATNQPLSVNLNVTVTDDDGDAMNVTFYNNTGAQIGTTQTNIANGSTAQVTWSGLSSNTTYYWYVNVTDGTNTTKSSVYNFTTDARPQVTANATSPSTIYTNTSIYVNITCADSDNSTVTAYIQPYLNGTVDESVSSQLINVSNNTLIYTYGSGNFSKGDNITFELWCGDGILNSTHINTTTRTIENAAPTQPTNITFLNSTVYVGQNLTANCSGSTDIDGDSITYYYEFIDLNTGQTVQNYSTNNTYLVQVSNAHHSIRVKCNASDSISSSSYFASSKTINNSLPTVPTLISPTNSSSNTDNSIAFDWNASTDADNDTLIYYLVINSSSNSTHIIYQSVVFLNLQHLYL